MNGTIEYWRECQKCQGAGEVPYNNGLIQRGFYEPVKCQRCDGTGKVKITRRYRKPKY